MTLVAELNTAITNAMRERDTARLTVYRGILGKAKMVAKNDGNREYTDDDVLNAVQKTAKEAQETKDILVANGKPTVNEDFELDTLKVFLPEPFTEGELNAIIDGLISEAASNNVVGNAAMGLVMKGLQLHRGKYDPRTVSQKVKERLAS